MPSFNARLSVSPEILKKLASEDQLSQEEKLFCAAAYDGSNNRINSDAIIDASSHGLDVGLLTAAGLWIRKRFRDRRKTRADLAVEKEAARINQTCTALSEMLLEYLRAAQEGSVDAESLGELTDNLSWVSGYYGAGKLITPCKKDLAAIRAAVGDFTAALEKEKNARPAQIDASPDRNDLILLREYLLRQQQLLG